MLMDFFFLSKDYCIYKFLNREEAAKLLILQINHQVKTFPPVSERCGFPFANLFKSFKLLLHWLYIKKVCKAEIDLFWRRFGVITLIIHWGLRGVEALWIRTYLRVGNFPTGSGGIHWPSTGFESYHNRSFFRVGVLLLGTALYFLGLTPSRYGFKGRCSEEADLHPEIRPQQASDLTHPWAHQNC